MWHAALFTHKQAFFEISRSEPARTLAGGQSEFLWVFDPIDGTKAFICGKPSWGTLIALLHNGTPVLGIIDQPITKERWIGVQGRQTLLNGEPVKARACSDLSQAYMYSTTPLMFAGAAESAYNRLRDQVWSPQYGADCYAYGLLATGFVDLVVEADLKPWDYLAMVPIIEGAGVFAVLCGMQLDVFACACLKPAPGTHDSRASQTSSRLWCPGKSRS